MNFSIIITLLIIFIFSRISKSFFAIMSRILENQNRTEGRQGETYRKYFIDEDQDKLLVEEEINTEERSNVNVEESLNSIVFEDRTENLYKGKEGRQRFRGERGEILIADSEEADGDGITFTEADILSGVIYKEILDQPRSRKPYSPLYLKRD